MSTYQTQGMILKITDRGESDQLFSIYTATAGKILALGKGTKKIKSKLNGQLRLFAIIDLMIAPGKNHDHVAAAAFAANFFGITNDLKKIIYASFALELVERLTKPGDGDEKIFALLAGYLQAINDHQYSSRQWPTIKQAFMVKFLTLLGLAPPAGIAQDVKKLEDFLNQHLEKPLETEKFLAKMSP